MCATLFITDLCFLWYRFLILKEQVKLVVGTVHSAYVCNKDHRCIGVEVLKITSFHLCSPFISVCIYFFTALFLTHIPTMCSVLSPTCNKYFKACC